MVVQDKIAAVLILRNAGPHGEPGVPEWGMLPILIQIKGAVATCQNNKSAI